MKFKKIRKIFLIVLASLAIMLTSLNLINFVTARDKAENYAGIEIVKVPPRDSKNNRQYFFSSFEEVYSVVEWGLFEHCVTVSGSVNLKYNIKSEYETHPFSGYVYINAITGNVVYGHLYVDGL